jgi:hypothetical protein
MTPQGDPDARIPAPPGAAGTNATGATSAGGPRRQAHPTDSTRRWPHVRRTAAQLLPSPSATPLASAMVGLLLLAGLVLNAHPSDLEAVVDWTSTNVHNLSQHPVAAMLASTFVVPGNLMPNLLIVAVSFAVTERAVGTRRTAAIALAGQVIATLLTEYGAAAGAHWHLLAASSATRADVGMSYVMFAALAASVTSLTGRAKPWGLVIVSGWVLTSVVLTPGMTSTGHLLSVAIGGAMMTLMQRRAATTRVSEPNANGKVKGHPTPSTPPPAGNFSFRTRVPRRRPGSRREPGSRLDDIAATALGHGTRGRSTDLARRPFQR